MPKFLILILILLFQSCNSLEGELHNYRSYSLVNENGEKIYIERGFYPASLELKSSKLFSIEIGDNSFEFKIPKGKDLPHEDGELRLSSEDVGQDFGIYGKLSSKVFLGELIRDSERCSWLERYLDCDDNQICRTRYRTLFGNKEVSYRNNIHQKKVVLNLNLDQSGEVIAQLLGEKKFIKKVYRYEGSCH